MKEQSNKPLKSKTQPTHSPFVASQNHPRTVRIAETDLPEVERSTRWGTALLGRRAKLVLEVDGYSQDPLQVILEERATFGRAYPDSNSNPDVDLTPFQAERKGVSRQHMALVRVDNTLKVEDLGSTNGTFLNGIQLYPRQPRLVRTGDIICLGQLILTVVSKD